MSMTSSVERVTWPQIVALVALICSTSTAFTIPSDHEKLTTAEPATTAASTTSTTTTTLNDHTTPLHDGRSRSSSTDSSPTPNDLTPPEDQLTNSATPPSSSSSSSIPTTMTTTTTTTTATTSSSSTIPTIRSNSEVTVTTTTAATYPTSTSSPIPLATQTQQQQQQQPPSQLLKQTIDRVENVLPLYQRRDNQRPVDNNLLPSKLQEQHIRSKIMENFLGLTRGVRLGPGFIFALLDDFMSQYEKSSVTATEGEESERDEEDPIYHHNHHYHPYHDNDDDDGDHFSRNHDREDIKDRPRHDESVPAYENESENEGLDQIDDIHHSFNRLLVQMTNHFSSHVLDEEGYRAFFESLLKVIQFYFDQLETTSSDRHWDGADGHLRLRNETMKELHLLLNILDQKDRLKAEMEMEEAEAEEREEEREEEEEEEEYEGGDMDEEKEKKEDESDLIEGMGIYEDLHYLLKRIISIIRETGDAEVNHCMDRCLVSHHQRDELLNRKFMRRRNMSRDNWNERLVEIQATSVNSNVGECRDPLPEVHQVSQYRYVLPAEEIPNGVEPHSPLTVGQRQGVMIPDHVELYRCRYRSGCCNHFSDHKEVVRICAAKTWTTIERVHQEMYVDIVDEEEVTKNVTRLYKFVNETECHCKVVSKRKYFCPTTFEFINDDVNNLDCVCNRNSTSYSTCINISRGLRKLSESATRCIRRNECRRPKCDYGQFDLDLSSCPKLPTR